MSWSWRFRIERPSSVCYCGRKVKVSILIGGADDDEGGGDQGTLDVREPGVSSSGEEHKYYEGQLNELLNRHHLTEQDHLEEIQLKKKKLQLKDQMNSMISKFRNELSHQHT